MTIIGISADGPEIWAESSKRHNITWVNLNAPGTPSEIAARYDVSGIPRQILISPEGIVVGDWGGWSEGRLLKEHVDWIE